MNMKQSCKALICAIEGELDGRHCTEEQAAAILDHALPSLTEDLARVEAAAKENLADERRATSFAHTLLAMAKSERDKAYAQLADVLYTLDQHRAWTGMGWEQLPVPVHAVDKIRSKLAQAEQQEVQGAQEGDECKRPPEGWKCSRAAGHQGPCAASKADPLSAEMSALELMQTWTGEDWSEMVERFPALAEQIEGARRAALATQPAAVSDLLAVIHRDGGHYQDQHGLEKAARDAEAIVQDERAAQITEQLWAVHAQGPDDLYAAFSREEAEAHAEALNAIPCPPGISVSAVVIESPWPAAYHWKYLVEQDREHNNAAVRGAEHE